MSASHTAWLVMAACGLWVIGMGLLTTCRWARRSATRTRELLIEPPEMNHDVTARAS